MCGQTSDDNGNDQYNEGEKTVIDLLGTAAYFGFVSLILNAVRMPVPDGGAVLPALK
jgi:hypothetical protein